MILKELKSLQTLADINDRPQRQAVYLAVLKNFSREETRLFFKLYNAVALSCSVTNKFYELFYQFDQKKPIAFLSKHFIELFTIWKNCQCNGDYQLKAQVACLLEDLNIAAIANRKALCLHHAALKNQEMKEIKYKLRAKGSKN
ncbi:MAG: hypothetical protein AAGI66_00055 [Cyanobacteria bacterium P01_H01_bin.74]